MPRKQDMDKSKMDFDGRHFYCSWLELSAREQVTQVLAAAKPGGGRSKLLVRELS